MSDSGRLPGDDEMNVSLSINEIRVLQHMAEKHSREIHNETPNNDWHDRDRRLSRITRIEDKLAAVIEAFNKGRR